MGWIDPIDQWLTEDQSMNNAQLVAYHFNKTWTPNSIAALCGNMRHESSINPNIYEFGYGHSPDRGYGLVQWTPATKLWNWCDSQGLDHTKGDSQLARIDYEKENGVQWFNNPNAPEFDGISFVEFTNSTDDISFMTKCFMAKYEHPNWSAGMDSLPDRVAFAQRCLNELDFEGGYIPPDPNVPIVTDKIYHLWLSGAMRWG